MTKDGWAELSRLLIERGYLFKDDEFGVLSLTEKARAALSARSPVLLPFNPAKTTDFGPDAGSQAGTLKFPKKTKAGIDPSDTKGVKILAALKTLRRGLAEAASVPPYVIFSDRTLEDIAAKKPADRGDLLDVFGIGEVKAERYGVFIMKAVREADK